MNIRAGETLLKAIIQNHKVLFVCAEESRSASNISLFMTEEAGETFNPICNHTKSTIL